MTRGHKSTIRAPVGAKKESCQSYVQTNSQFSSEGLAFMNLLAPSEALRDNKL